MPEDDIQREIEANQRRARDEQDVGLDENVLNEDEQDGTIVEDLVDSVFDRGDEPDEDSHEYEDNTRATRPGQ